MSETKHTPGPWGIGEWATLPVIQDQQGRDIAFVRDGYADEAEEQHIFAPDEIEANARLIASAPELLKALENINGWLTYQPLDRLAEMEMKREARNAIAKARGES